jgi:hypothetical protein
MAQGAIAGLPRKDDERTWLAVRALLLAVALMAGTWHLGAAAS